MDATKTRLELRLDQPEQSPDSRHSERDEQSDPSNCKGQQCSIQSFTELATETFVNREMQREVLALPLPQQHGPQHKSSHREEEPYCSSMRYLNELVAISEHTHRSIAKKTRLPNMLLGKKVNTEQSVPKPDSAKGKRRGERARGKPVL
jgi:hypothetical protein